MRRVTRQAIGRQAIGRLLAGALLGAGIGALGCGGSTKTVSVSGSPPPPATQASTSTTKTPPATTGTTTTGQSSNGGTPATTTRTAPAPAFAQQGTSAEGLSAAQATVRAQGYTANSASDYHAGQTLRVLVGARTGSTGNGSRREERAFFFVNGRYIGTDASQPSAGVKVLSQGDTEVTLAYPLYRAHDPLCCPSGGQAKVRFQLNNGRLTPLDPIPPVSSASGLSRQ
jgi:LppP/LprE lipoprotein